VPPHPDHVVSCDIGVEALVLAILDGDHALYEVGQRLEERGMLPLLQACLRRNSLNDYRLGHLLDALFAANLNHVLSALTLKAPARTRLPTMIPMPITPPVTSARYSTTKAWAPAALLTLSALRGRAI
jgi:hypothetical protein